MGAGVFKNRPVTRQSTHKSPIREAEMNCRETLHAIETTTALEIIGIGYEPKGAYLALPCPNKCEGSAV